MLCSVYCRSKPDLSYSLEISVCIQLLRLVKYVRFMKHAKKFAFSGKDIAFSVDGC